MGDSEAAIIYMDSVGIKISTLWTQPTRSSLIWDISNEVLAIENNQYQYTIGVSHDRSKAFDTIDPKVLQKA